MKSKQLKKINEIAQYVESAYDKTTTTDFYGCYLDWKSGVFCYQRQASAFIQAVKIYDYIYDTDIYNEFV